MPSKVRSCVDRRQLLAGVMATAGGALVSPVRALAAAVPAPEKAYAAFFLGQGGYLFSWGIPYLAYQARGFGMETDIFGYAELRAAWKKIFQKKRDGYKIALVGYSLGNTTVTYLQKHFEVDLVLAISESSLGRNHPIKKENTKRSVLWYGPDFLSNAGTNDGFDKITYITNLHPFMDVDPRVVSDVLDELKTLVTTEKADMVAVAQASDGTRPADNTAAGTAVATTQVSASQVSASPMSASPVPITNTFAGWVAPSHVITPDVTCATCWGFEPHLASADHWLR
jgi:hypothetical protein